MRCFVSVFCVGRHHHHMNRNNKNSSSANRNKKEVIWSKHTIIIILNKIFMYVSGSRKLHKRRYRCRKFQGRFKGYEIKILTSFFLLILYVYYLIMIAKLWNTKKLWRVLYLIQILVYQILSPGTNKYAFYYYNTSWKVGN
jgi:hypothetical protein